MIKLKNIKEINGVVSCAFIPEDSNGEGKIVYDRNNDRAEIVYPSGYEWCKNHVNHAIRFIRETKGLPTERLITWG